MIAECTDGAFVACRQGELLRIDAWGCDALRVRATRYAEFSGRDWALTEDVPRGELKVKRREGLVCVHVDCTAEDDNAWLVSNGRMAVEVNRAGVLSFYRDGEFLFREHFRNYEGTISRESHCLKMEGRTYKAHFGGDWRIVQRFEGTPGEKIFGMGQYQQTQTNLKRLRARPRAAQLPGVGALYGVESGLWVPVEQSGCGTRNLWRKHHRVGDGVLQGARLLDLRW